MNLYIITESKKTIEITAPLLRSRSFKGQIISPGTERRCSGESENILVYLDGTGLDIKEIRRKIKSLLKNRRIILGLIDPKGAVDDPSELFHLGLCDYLGRSCLKNPLKAARLNRSLDFFERVYPSDCAGEEEPAEEEESNYSLLPGGNWDLVRKGKSYTFCFLVELDLPSDWKKKAGKDHLKKAKDLFHNHIKRTVEPSNGRVWMWNEFGGLVLFPFERSSCRAVNTAVRMVLNRTIFSTEEFPFKTRIDYRLALHLGETEYRKRGETGTIVSDTINFIFHLGQQFAEPGGFYMTEEIFSTMNPGFKSLFIDQGEFENRRILKMKDRK